MIDYLIQYPDYIIVPFLEHLKITAITMLLSCLIAGLVSVLIMRSKVLSNLVVGMFSAVYAVPSLALFAMLIPFLGLGERTAIFVLTVYNQYILVKNIIAGFQSINPAIIEAAYGMGMSDLQIFFKVRLPLASPIILAGMKVAVVSTIGIATIAATINAGGLGTLLFDGLRTQNMVKIAWGTLLSSLLAVGANSLLNLLERKVQKITNEN
jgi:osmoprotectant transport system permease protein